MRYLGASIVIDGTDPNSPLYLTIASALRVAHLDETAVSELVRMECLIHPVRRGDASRTATLERFLAPLVSLPLDRAVYDLAIDLRARHQGLKTPSIWRSRFAMDAWNSGRMTGTSRSDPSD